MSCKCFDLKAPNSDINFDQRVSLCKCNCNSRLTACENKKKFTIKKKSETKIIDKIKIDGFLFNTANFKKCDYLFIHEDIQNNITFIFVELKGTDIVTAISQIENTIDIFYDNKYLINKRVRGAIAFSTYPKDNGTYRKAKRTLEKKITKKINDFSIEQKSIKICYDPITDLFSQE